MDSPEWVHLSSEGLKPGLPRDLPAPASFLTLDSVSFAAFRSPLGLMPGLVLLGAHLRCGPHLPSGL